MKVDIQVGLCLVLIQIFFGVNFVCSKIIVEAINPLLWTSVRFLAAGGILYAYMRLKDLPSPEFLAKGDRTKIAALSLLGMGVGQLLIMYSLKFTEAVNVALITSTIPVWVFALLALSSMEAMKINKLLGLLVCAGGFVYMKDFSGLDFSSDSFKGDLLALGGVMMIASYIAFLKPLAMKYNHFWLSATGFLWCGFLLLIPALFIAPLKVQTSSAAILGANIFFSIVFGTTLTYLMNNWVLKRVNSSFTALFIYLQPVAAAVLSYATFGTKIEPRMLTASIVIFAGIILSTRQAPKHP